MNYERLAQGILDGIAGYNSVKVANQEGFKTTRKSRVIRISLSWKPGTAINDNDVTMFRNAMNP